MAGWKCLLAALLAPLAIAGCGSAAVTTVTTAEPHAASSQPGSAQTGTVGAHEQSKRALNNPAQEPDPSVTAYCNQVPLGHPCHAVTAAPEDPNVAPQRNCDTNIVANSHTSCAFAENAFYEYYKSRANGAASISISVHSPTTGRDYELGCGNSNGLVGCVSSPMSDFIFVDFPLAAIRHYTEAQANAYSATRDVGHPPTPAANGQLEAQSPEHDQNGPSGGDEGSESGEDEVGSYSHAGDETFCKEHECIGEFETEDGYVAECADGSYSHSGGKSGACSDHGGETRR